MDLYKEDGEDIRPRGSYFEKHDTMGTLSFRIFEKVLSGDRSHVGAAGVVYFLCLHLAFINFPVI